MLNNESTDTGDIILNKKHILYSFSIYDVDVVVDDSNRFIGIESIKISKSFIDAAKLPYDGMSAEDILDDFLEEQDD